MKAAVSLRDAAIYLFSFLPYDYGKQWSASHYYWFKSIIFGNNMGGRIFKFQSLNFQSNPNINLLQQSLTLMLCLVRLFYINCEYSRLPGYQPNNAIPLLWNGLLLLWQNISEILADLGNAQELIGIAIRNCTVSEPLNLVSITV